MNSRAPQHASSRANARYRRSATPERRRKKIITLVVIAAVLSPVAWFTVRSVVVAANLFSAVSTASRIQDEISDFDYDSLSIRMGQLNFQISSAQSGTEDPTWRLAEKLPFLGENLYAVRMVVESANLLVDDVATPAIEALASGAETGESSGRFDLSALATVAPIIETAPTALKMSSDRISSVDTTKTPTIVRDKLSDLNDTLIAANDAAVQFGPVLKVAGAMLGQNESRNYVLAFQNNAESTALGGSAASFALLTADKGDIETRAKASSASFYNPYAPYKAVDVDVDQSALDLYGTFLIDHSNTSTSRPDFPTAAEIIQAWWQRDIGDSIDGVVSVDPIALSYMLDATGPISLSTGDVLSSDNAVDLLLNEVYFRWDSYSEPEKVDAFFQEASQAIINKMTSGDFDPVKMVKAFLHGVDNGSVMMWSSRPEEQATLDGSRVQGVLPKSNDAETVVGVYYRDTSASKIDYYLETSTSTQTDLCAAPATPSFATAATLHSNLTMDQANALPAYVKSATFGSEKFSTEVFLYGPVGATLSGTSVDGGGAGSTYVTSAIDLGRPVAKFMVFLAPGETATVNASFTGASGSYGPLEMRGTPMINATERSVTQSCG